MCTGGRGSPKNFRKADFFYLITAAKRPEFFSFFSFLPLPPWRKTVHIYGENNVKQEKELSPFLLTLKIGKAFVITYLFIYLMICIYTKI